MTSAYVKKEAHEHFSSLPLSGTLILTNRCNNNCLHCWINVPLGDVQARRDELSFAEIRRIVDDARAMGCREWSITGGEPMARPDFADIFDYVTQRASRYSLNTAGTLITPKIAQLMRRRGSKLIALYGATPEVCDRVTRNPGSFEATLRGIRYLKEAGAAFTVQIIPMKENFHEYDAMVRLAESFSPKWRHGAEWLYLRGDGDPAKNREILRQRLAPEEAAKLSRPDAMHEAAREDAVRRLSREDHELAQAYVERTTFAINAAGRASLCLVSTANPDLCYDLRKGNFKEFWETFLPSLGKKLTLEIAKNRQPCKSQRCFCYGYLEQRRFASPVNYLEEIAQEEEKQSAEWKKHHRRYYRIADITLQVDSDLPILANTYDTKYSSFEVEGPGNDTIKIRHRFFIPSLDEGKLGDKIYNQVPWSVYRTDSSWIYKGIYPYPGRKDTHELAVVSRDHRHAVVYHPRTDLFIRGGLMTLSLQPSDQLLLGRALADRQGCYLHASGVKFEGQGLIFAGPSEAGKSTMASLLQPRAKVLCDERIIVRKYAEGFRMFGTWSHGDFPVVAPDMAPLRAICFLHKAGENRLERRHDSTEIHQQILMNLPRPLSTADWWTKVLPVTREMASQVPCYNLYFRKDESVVDFIERAFVASEETVGAW